MDCVVTSLNRCFDNQAAQLLLRHGLNANLGNPWDKGRTLIFESGSERTKLFLQHGADPLFKDRGGEDTWAYHLRKEHEKGREGWTEALLQFHVDLTAHSGDLLASISAAVAVPTVLCVLIRNYVHIVPELPEHVVYTATYPLPSPTPPTAPAPLVWSGTATIKNPYPLSPFALRHVGRHLDPPAEKLALTYLRQVLPHFGTTAACIHFMKHYLLPRSTTHPWHLVQPLLNRLNSLTLPKQEFDRMQSLFLALQRE